jgi:phosphatidylglycerol lysyltransferase
VRHVERDGGSLEIVPAADVPALIPELRAVSDAWLARKRTAEKGFSLGSFEPEYIRRFPVAVVRVQGRVVAFTNIWTAAPGTELSVDLMRFAEDAPPGVMEYLFTRTMLWGREQGYAWFSLGMAPLAGIEARRLAPLWNRLAGLVFRHGEHFYNFQGLRAYKEKFDPVWEPRYLASPGGLALPRVLANVSALIAGGLRGVVSR